MPTIHVELFKGRSVEQKRAAAQAITEAVVKTLGGSPDSVDVIFRDVERHAWATERLWEGLTVPSSEAWQAGAKALSTTPFPAEILKQGGVHGRSAASDFGKLVVKAPTAKTLEERAALYAELLVTCGGCHRAINEAGSK